MTLWSTLGWIAEVSSREEAAEIVKDKVAEYDNQKITLSWVEGGNQVDRVLHDGTDPEKEEAWLEIIRYSR